MKENNKGKNLLKILQENYDIETPRDRNGDFGPKIVAKINKMYLE